MIKQLINMPALKFHEIEYSESIIRICASIKSRRSRCPSCGKYSKRVHDYYFRRITDLPVFQNRTVIQVYDTDHIPTDMALGKTLLA